jgi:hypothetical protein
MSASLFLERLIVQRVQVVCMPVYLDAVLLAVPTPSIDSMSRQAGRKETIKRTGFWIRSP